MESPKRPAASTDEAPPQKAARVAPLHPIVCDAKAEPLEPTPEASAPLHATAVKSPGAVPANQIGAPTVACVPRLAMLTAPPVPSPSPSPEKSGDRDLLCGIDHKIAQPVLAKAERDRKRKIFMRALEQTSQRRGSAIKIPDQLAARIRTSDQGPAHWFNVHLDGGESIANLE